MKKIIALTAAAVVGLAILAKTTNASSYLCTLWSQARVAAKQSVPTKFEIDRIRNDIAGLDQELDRMIRPIAEHKVAVERLRKEVAAGEDRLGEQKKVLLDATDAVKKAKKGDKLFYGGRGYGVEQVKTKIAIDFESFKRFEANVSAQRRLLESKEDTLRAAQEQLQSFMSKKREFEVQLAQLEAEFEINQVAAIGTDIKIDNTQVSNIAKALSDLKDSIDTDKIRLEVKTGILNANGIPLNQPQQAVVVDLEAIQAHLQGNATAKTTTTVSSK